jgi:hypothetical protein
VPIIARLCSRSAALATAMQLSLPTGRWLIEARVPYNLQKVVGYLRLRGMGFCYEPLEPLAPLAPIAPSPPLSFGPLPYLPYLASLPYGPYLRYLPSSRHTLSHPTPNLPTLFSCALTHARLLSSDACLSGAKPTPRRLSPIQPPPRTHRHRLALSPSVTVPESYNRIMCAASCYSWSAPLRAPPHLDFADGFACSQPSRPA